MIYTKQPNDIRYRLVNLRLWDRSVSMGEFPSDHQVQDDSLYEVLEVEHSDGSREIIPDENGKEHAYCRVDSGRIEVIFSGNRVRKEVRPCVGHLSVVYKNRKGIRYHFPRIEGSSGSEDSPNIIYKALIGTNIQDSDVQIVGDQYFVSAFKLERG